jgi:xanthine dehydrogenase accessory factor
MSFPQHPSSSPEIAQNVLDILKRGVTASLITVISAPQFVGRKLLVEETGVTSGSLGNELLDKVAAHFSDSFLSTRAETAVHQLAKIGAIEPGWDDAELLFERIEPEPKVVICGAGHVGAALAQIAGVAGYKTILIDDRESFLTRERFPDTSVQLVAASNWETAVASAVGSGRGVSVAVVTRGHNEDELCLRAAVAGLPDYVGLIGSRRRTNIVLQRLIASGVDPEIVSGVHAPIGLDIGAVTPEEVAVSIFSEIIAIRRGGRGGSMSAWRRDQHADRSKLDASRESIT